MTDRSAIQATAPESRQSVRDPYIDEIIGPGKLYETETVLVSGVAHEVFRGAPRTLADIYQVAEALGDRTMIVNADRRADRRWRNRALHASPGRHGRPCRGR